MSKKIIISIVIVQLLGLSQTVFNMDITTLPKYTVAEICPGNTENSTPVRLEFDEWTNTVLMKSTQSTAVKIPIMIALDASVLRSIKETHDTLENKQSELSVQLNHPCETPLLLNMRVANLNKVISEKPSNPEEKYIIKSFELIHQLTPQSTNLQGTIRHSWKAFGTNRSDMTKELEVDTHPFWIRISDKDWKFATSLDESTNDLIKNAITGSMPFALTIEPLYGENKTPITILINEFQKQPTEPNVSNGQPITAPSYIQPSSSHMMLIAKSGIILAAFAGIIFYLKQQYPDFFAQYFYT